MASGYQLAMGSMGIVSTLLCICCFFSVKERITHKTEHIHFPTQFKNLMKNDQWLILGVSIALIMFGGIVRNSGCGLLRQVLSARRQRADFAIPDHRRRGVRYGDAAGRDHYPLLR
ncbi:hypothetical protein LNQ52_00400 [Klebsiella pneumoniae subsp. pneumoniae]|nr:hypothetical protein [Klebsiella pneumoniae subsp. pneumoniae]